MRELLFKVARSDVSGHFIGYAFENMTSLMPLDRVVETSKTIVFKHPVPQWENHLLAVPKKSLRDFSAIDFNNPDHIAHLKDLFISIQQASSRMKLDAYAIMMNGGEYQDVPQLHFHIIAGESKDGTSPLYPSYRKSVKGKTIDQEDGVIVLESSSPFREFHRVVYSKNTQKTVQNLNLGDDKQLQTLSKILETAQDVIHNSELDRYTLLTVHQPSEVGLDLTFHLISGESTDTK